MASLLTLPGPQYQAYNTSLASIALQGIELGQREMAQRDQNAQNAVNNSMKAAEMAAAQVQQVQENLFKKRELDRADLALQWQHGIDQRRLGLAEQEFGESVRQFDATMPLRQRELAIGERNVSVREAQEERAAEEWDISGRPMARAQMGLTSAALDIQGKNIALDLEKAKLLKREADFAASTAEAPESIDYKFLMDAHKESYNSVQDMYRNQISLLNLSDSKNTGDDINAQIIAGMAGRGSAAPSEPSPVPGGTHRLAAAPGGSGGPAAAGNSMRNMDPAQFAILQRGSADMAVLQGLSALVTNSLGPVGALNGKASEQQIKAYVQADALFKAKLQETVSNLSRFDPAKSFAPKSASEAGSAAAGASGRRPATSQPPPSNMYNDGYRTD